MTRVLLLIDHRENRRLLADWLSQRNEVVIADDDQALKTLFDVGIIDGPSLNRLWKPIQDRKIAELPCFLPLLLMTARQNVGLITRQLWQSIDELILLPIEKVELMLRVEVLLRARRCSLDLKESVFTRDEFLLVTAHESRTPLATIRSLAQSMASSLESGQTPDPIQIQQIFQAIDQQAETVSHLVSQLRDISRIESGQIILSRKITDVTRLVEGVTLAVQISANSHHITLIAPAPVMAWVDSLRLRQVLTNLIDNAIKYTPEGATIDLEVFTADPQTACIAVTDHGPGIAPEHRERIFDRFYRIRSGDDISGMGLGLYISRQIVNLHGGRIVAEFPPDGGTRFVISLPAASNLPLYVD